MNILELREPEIAINTAINIIEQLEDLELEKLIELNKLKDNRNRSEERRVGKEC